MRQPIAAAKSPDRRSRKTRQALSDALLSLAGRRAWDEISVQDICDAADVGRSTFYTHYSGKEALLEAGLRDFGEALRQAAPSREPFGYVAGLIAHVAAERRVFRSIIGRRSGQAAQARFREMLLDLVERDLSARLVGDGELVVRCVVGALFEALVLVAEKGRAIDATVVRRRLAALAA